MTAPRSLTVADDPTLARLIQQAQRRVVFLAPAFSEQVARALAERWQVLGAEAVTVIVDVDAEAYRLGYGRFEALRQLQQVAASVGGVVTQQPGVRLGLLIADDETLVWAPHAELIEAGPRRPEAPNAIRLGLPPADVEADLGQGPDGAVSRTVGLDAAPREKLEQVDVSLKLNPPQKFDIARQVRIFNAFFEFVEFRLTHVLIDRKTVPLPADLMGVADKKTQQKLHTAIRLLDPDDGLSGQPLLEDRNRIEKRHLKRIAGHGLAIKRTDKVAFEADVAKLRQRVETFREALRAELQAKMDQSRQALAEALLPAVSQNPPARWTESCLYGDSEPEQFLAWDLAAAFGRAEQLIQPMQVVVNYKAVTYESLRDEAFMAAARRAFPDLAQLHSEQDVAAPVAPSNQPPLNQEAA